MTDLYHNGTIFTSDARRWATAMVVQDGHIVYVGDDATAERIAGHATQVCDFHGATVLPGFVDAHAHVVFTGETSQQLDLSTASSLDEIQTGIADYAASHQQASRIQAHGWQHSAIGGAPTREMLDAVVSEKPVYAQSHDFHSMWLNSAALEEVGIDEDTASPSGGEIHRDASGRATGYVVEMAMQMLVWPVLAAFKTESDADATLESALRSYREAGITASTEMALNEEDLAAMLRAESAGKLTARIAGHWLVQPTGERESNLAQVRHAGKLARDHSSERLRVAGIKVIIDGTVDGCTAALVHPYADGTNADPIWSLDELAPVVIEADAAGLQVAMHAIGDAAIRVAISAVEQAIATNGPRSRRHRIEHLEVVGPDEIARLAALGITASMQPVHADPAIQKNWQEVLNDTRIERAYPWPEITDGGAPLAFGTDSPTAPHLPLPNMFIAATRRSAIDPGLAPNVPGYALPLVEAIEHATRDAAFACRADNAYGRLSAGLHADFIVLDRDIFSRPIEELLEASVTRTVVSGTTIYEA